ncbi:hypothetical protein KIW84_052678 [Lathyrus oleraceus]|uniref:Uncharacterized protein n=1 Tax=Pisum sativum TaxID=3888 RepID=A0A9D5AC97_PEA|nr:hypothetical protein KIW84_052678 [Pisum sativum]
MHLKSSMPEPAAAEPPVLKEVNEPKAEAEKMKKITAKPKHADYLDDIYKLYKLVENESRLHDYRDSQPEIQVQQDVLAPSNNIPALNANTLLRIWTRQLVPRLRMTLVLLLDTFCFAEWLPLVQAGLKVLTLPNLRRLNLRKSQQHTNFCNNTICSPLDKDNKSAYTYLGLALSSIGEYRKAEEAYLKSLQLDKSFLEAWGHLAQFYQELSNPTKAFECLTEVLQIDGRFARAYHLRGLSFHAMGEHRKAIKDLTMGLNIDGANIESLYLRAACYHAVGQYKGDQGL